jgi:hypothetical protein
MLNILGGVALSYLAGSGTVTNAAVVGRGLFRCACRAAEGRFHEAAVEALAGLAAPGPDELRRDRQPRAGRH